MVINEMFSTEDKANKEFFKVPANVQQYFDLKKQDENLGEEIAERIVRKLSKEKKPATNTN